MFSSVLDKVVSTTAPGTLATFPPRADLPASSSTLCCLSFVDRFISRYTTAVNTAIEGDIDGRLLLGRAGRPAGIAISADDLEATMESAAELGGRLAAALAGTVRSKRSSEPATAPVPDLLAKVRGIFGNRLTCVGREIRVSRNEQAERDETLLLRQIHTLKNAALDACNGEKWSIVVSSGGESLAVCCVPLPAVEEGGACGCDFLIFDPWPRPAMKLRGSYIVKFTTVRFVTLSSCEMVLYVFGACSLQYLVQEDLQPQCLCQYVTGTVNRYIILCFAPFHVAVLHSLSVLILSVATVLSPQAKGSPASPTFGAGRNLERRRFAAGEWVEERVCWFISGDDSEREGRRTSRCGLEAPVGRQR